MLTVWYWSKVIHDGHLCLQPDLVGVWDSENRLVSGAASFNTNFVCVCVEEGCSSCLPVEYFLIFY